MSKSFQTYLTVWTVSFVAFVVLAFSIGGQGSALLQKPAWPLYGFAAAAFLVQLICGYITFRNDELNKSFLGLPILTVSSAATIILAAASLAFANIPNIPLWIGVCTCTVILTLSVIVTVGAKASADYIASTDTTKMQAVSMMRGLTAKASALTDRANSPEAKAIAKRVYEALRYSDPVSSPATDAIEQELAVVLDKFSLAIKEENIAGVKEFSDELCNLVIERTEICKPDK